MAERPRRSARRERWAKVARLVAPHRRRVAGLAVASFLGGVVEAAFLVMVTRTALAIADGRESFGLFAGRTTSIAWALTVAGVLLVLRLVSALLTVHLSSSLVTQVLTEVRSQLADAYLRTSWSIQHSEPPARLQELLASFASSASDVVSYLNMAIIGALNLAALLAVSLAVNPIATVVVVVVLGALGSVLAPLRGRIRARAQALTQVQVRFATEIAELGALSLEMQTTGVREQFADRLSRLMEQEASTRRNVLTLRSSIAPIYTFLAFGAMVGALAVSAALSAGELGGAAAVMLIMLRALSYGQQVQTSTGALAASTPYVDALAETIQLYRAGRRPEGDAVLDAIEAIEAHGVSFAYRPGQPVLHTLSFRIEPGEIVGIIGPSGSGKSTLVQLLLGLREPTNGRITVAGTDLQKIDTRWWTEHTAFVAQDAQLLSSSIVDNVVFFRERIDREHVDDALRRAHLTDDLASMPNGAETRVGERGNELSGGQRQRISIARALAGRPGLLILDEPTSALDVRSESLIRETIHELRGHVTVVIIAHRLSTLDICDRIMVIQDGHLKAMDESSSLARDNEFYRRSLELSGMQV